MFCGTLLPVVSRTDNLLQAPSDMPFLVSRRWSLSVRMRPELSQRVTRRPVTGGSRVVCEINIETRAQDALYRLMWKHAVHEYKTDVVS